MVKKIIEQHNGTIKLISRPEEGTKFIFTLPISENIG
ncbi:ATP-binding protein [Salegentibacter tibetensis]